MYEGVFFVSNFKQFAFLASLNFECSHAISENDKNYELGKTGKTVYIRNIY